MESHDFGTEVLNPSPLHLASSGASDGEVASLSSTQVNSTVLQGNRNPSSETLNIDLQIRKRVLPAASLEVPRRLPTTRRQHRRIKQEPLTGHHKALVLPRQMDAPNGNLPGLLSSGKLRQTKTLRLLRV